MQKAKYADSLLHPSHHDSDDDNKDDHDICHTGTLASRAGCI